MYLENEKGKLYYKDMGEGEALLLIHGVLVDGEFFLEAAKLLKKHYRVITVDRRGNGRSTYQGEAKFSLKEQVEDMIALLDVLNIESAYVLGASGGGVIGYRFLTNYPERVKKLLLYEPAFMSYIKERNAEYSSWLSEMGELLQKKRYNTALLKFYRSIGKPDERALEKSEAFSMRSMKNAYYVLEQELLGLMESVLRAEEMREFRDKIMLACGERSGDSPYAVAAEQLARETGIALLHYPGGHNLPFDLPVDFALCVCGTLELFGK